jgi:hypothetical protein
MRSALNGLKERRLDSREGGGQYWSPSGQIGSHFPRELELFRNDDDFQKEANRRLEIPLEMEVILLFG